MNEPYSDMDKDLKNDDFSIIRKSFKKFPGDRLAYNLTFLCWIYFTHLLRKEYFVLRTGGDLNFEVNVVQAFLYFDETPITEYQKIVAAERVLKFRLLTAQWIRFLFCESADIVKTVVIPGRGFGYLAMTNDNMVIFNHLTGHLLAVSANLSRFLLKEKYSSMFASKSENFQILYGFLSLVNHECQSPFTFLYCHHGVIKTCCKLPINEEETTNEEVIEDIHIPNMKYGIGHQVVVDYGSVGNFECYCFCCNK
jgi:hypothetical protein